MYRRPQNNRGRRQKGQGEEPQEITRVKLPQGREVLGIVETRLGFGKSRIICSDGKTRICRVPGHLRRALWVRPDDVVIVEPWEVEGDAKGDIVYVYKGNQANWLRSRGYLKTLLKEEL
ncbi:MAG TPA: translation initiation factor eIF-1A [Candidatus Nanoarchaeia archaeon]|nr:translation initiation factor eIF-1A [Candidatus Nanoarchaeia archaeon]